MKLSDPAEQLLYNIVNTPSWSHNERDAVNLLVAWMGDNGFDQAYVDEVGNAVGIIGNGSRDIMLLGHIDTFGGFPPVRIEGRKLYGRGAVDAKGALCAFTASAVQAQLADNVRLVVVGAVEEEAASSKGARHIAQQFRPEWCIIGEPSNWDRITMGYKGRLVLSWSWTGELAHSASDIATAPERAFDYWERITKFCATFNHQRESLFGRLDARLQAIHSSDDGLLGKTEMTIGFRLPPEMPPDELIAHIGTDGDAQIEIYGAEKAVTGERDSELSRALRRAIRAQDGTPRFVYKTGTADMNVVAPVWKCQILAYGAGDSNLDHTPNEHIDLDEYQRSIHILSDTLSSLGKQG
jgi:LysW-gamma-L-lysine carboxypeptidase